MKISQRLSVSAVVVAVAAGLSTAGLQAAHQADSVGKYSTRVDESRLFIDGGTKLRCDLFFSAPNGETAVAEKGSLVSQQVPAFVWQYSGLLPVSDYMKTIAIHGVATDQKISRWQDVQHTFYKGLRAEGAVEVDAKIAYAGAYAFAPRWPLVELVEIPDELKIADTKLYSVAVTGPAKKGLSIEDYRAMTRDILDRSENVTLQDIRGVVDAVDAGEGDYKKTGLLAKLVKKIKQLGTPESVLIKITPEDADEWVVMPDGSAVLREVSSQAKNS